MGMPPAMQQNPQPVPAALQQTAGSVPRLHRHRAVVRQAPEMYHREQALPETGREGRTRPVSAGKCLWSRSMRS